MGTVTGERRRIATAGRIDQLPGGRTGAGQMLCQSQEMQVGAIIENGAAGGNTERTAQIAHQIEQSGGQFQPLGSQAPQCQGDSRGNGKLLRESAKGLWQEQLAPTPLVGD